MCVTTGTQCNSRNSIAKNPVTITGIYVVRAISTGPKAVGAPINRKKRKKKKDDNLWKCTWSQTYQSRPHILSGTHLN